MRENERAGSYIKCSLDSEPYLAYLPSPLPPHPPIDMEAFYPLLDKANAALGRLDGMSIVLPDPSLFLYMYIRKEAVLSSQIEGTQSSLSDLLLFETKEAPGVPLDDVTEVSCYVCALNHGLKRIQELPLSLRLLCEIHEKLMNNARGGSKMPGEFRATQNWIGGTRPGNARFVPPPPQYLMETLKAMEKFLHDDSIKLPVLIKAALTHVQFETIHPFLDGNGQLGRLLITLILVAEGLLKEPLLYLSLYFKANRQAYYEHLQSVREAGDWEAWISFFLTGVIETANQATDTAQAIIALFKKDQAAIEHAKKSKAARIHAFMQKHPVVTTSKIKTDCRIALPTVLRALKALEELNIVKEITGKERHKIFIYREYIAILSKGTEPIVY